MAWVNKPFPPDLSDLWRPCEPPTSVWNPVPAGYDATLPNLGAAVTMMPIPPVSQPLLGSPVFGQLPLGTPNRDPTQGVFTRDVGLVPGTVGGLPPPVTYIEADARGGGIGLGFAVGVSHISFKPPVHGTLP